VLKRRGQSGKVQSTFLGVAGIGIVEVLGKVRICRNDADEEEML
jgi:hypothetical protein